MTFAPISKLKPLRAKAENSLALRFVQFDTTKRPEGALAGEDDGCDQIIGLFKRNGGRFPCDALGLKFLREPAFRLAAALATPHGDFRIGGVVERLDAISEGHGKFAKRLHLCRADILEFFRALRMMASRSCFSVIMRCSSR